MNERKLQERCLLMVYGPMCSGKTSVVNILTGRYEQIFRGSTDYLKWLISDCGLNKYKSLNNLMTLRLTETALENGLSAIVDSTSHILAELSGDFNSIANRYGVKFHEVNLEASYDTLLSRFNERVDKQINGACGTKLTIVSESEMKRRYDLYQKNKKPNLPTFSSDKYTAEEISNQIETIITNHSEHDAMKQPEKDTMGGRK